MLVNLADYRVLPVVTTIDATSTVALAGTLWRAGMKAIEITLRSDSAVDSIAAVREAVPDMLVAAGTVVDEDSVDRALAAGASLLVSPGTSAGLYAAVAEREAPFLPGVATASEVVTGLEAGYRSFKLFPAAAAGGIPLLKSFAGPFPEVRFCPTGGLDADNFRDYLALPNVVCCGGSWMVTPALVEQGDWPRIEALARQAMT
jgi:2-dehydro-3-deoxyphosphogluconate aldolase / (4S)-4-hydroxy-2-oxoglutarate aldolase